MYVLCMLGTQEYLRLPRVVNIDTYYNSEFEEEEKNTRKSIF